MDAEVGLRQMRRHFTEGVLVEVMEWEWIGVNGSDGCGRGGAGAEVCYFEAVDIDGFGLYGNRWVVKTGVFVGPLTVNLDGAEHRGHLHDGASELRQRLFKQGRGDMLVGVVVVDGALKVEAGCGGTEDESASVDLVAILQLGDSLGGLADADEQQPCGQWVEGAGMAYLKLFKAVAVSHYGLDFVDSLEGGPLSGLVDGQDDACLKLLEGYHST